MEFRVLQYFLAVAREQSLSGAAKSLHLSQPTLSRQLKELEDELGKQLFTRSSRGISLTEEGMLLRERGEEIVRLMKKTEDEIAFSDEIAGDVYIGAGESDTNRIIGRAAFELRKSYPGIRCHIASGNAVFVLEQLGRGLIDFGLVYGPVDHARYEAIRLPLPDRFGVLMRRDSELADRAYITPEELLDKPLIISAQEQQNGWPTLSAIAADVSRLNIAATYTLLYNGSLLVEEGLGYAICFDKLINTRGTSLCFRPLRPTLEITAHLIWKKYQLLSKPAQKFLTKLQELYSEG